MVRILLAAALPRNGTLERGLRRMAEARASRRRDGRGGRQHPALAAALARPAAAAVWSVLPLAVTYAAPGDAANTPIIAFLTTALSMLPRMGFLAVSAAAYARLEQHSLTAVAAAFD